MRTRSQLEGAGLTSYLGVCGTDHTTGDGMLFRSSRVRFADATDGTSNTLLICERPPSTGNGGFGWWYAGVGQDSAGSGDMLLGVREINRRSSSYTEGCGVGPYRFLSGADEPCDTFHFWSRHPGGANAAFADGSLRFLRYAADEMLPALATRAGGEVSTVPE
ncbi:DUF1559 family PulG-like putative transporter [Gemmata algarum]|uniref:DUF1559 family PulG-like putative transporter n=1 Tax=Gemmata algarum TaxID=2975278 RepID=UPI0038B33FBF